MKYLIVFFMILNVSAKLPTWVENSSKSCKKGYLCAVGEGESRTQAARFARVALSKIFDNKISSSFSSTLSNNNGDVSDSVVEAVQEKTTTALEGVEIIKTAESKTNYYALAQLNKRKTATGFKREIIKLDTQMKTLISEDDPSLAIRLESIYQERELLNKRYSFLTGQSIDSDIDFESVFLNKKSAMENLIVHVYLDEAEPKNIESVLGADLSNLGYKISTGTVRNKNSTHIVTGEVSAEKMHLNIKGFEKYNFLVKVSASNIKRVKMGSFNISTIETGRSYQQAYEKALVKIKEELKNKVKNLSLK